MDTFKTPRLQESLADYVLRNVSRLNANTTLPALLT